MPLAGLGRAQPFRDLLPADLLGHLKDIVTALDRRRDAAGDDEAGVFSIGPDLLVAQLDAQPVDHPDPVVEIR